MDDLIDGLPNTTYNRGGGGTTIAPTTLLPNFQEAERLTQQLSELLTELGRDGFEVGLQEGLLAQIEGRIDNFSKRPGVEFPWPFFGLIGGCFTYPPKKRLGIVTIDELGIPALNQRGLVWGLTSPELPKVILSNGYLSP